MTAPPTPEKPAPAWARWLARGMLVVTCVVVGACGVSWALMLAPLERLREFNEHAEDNLTGNRFLVESGPQPQVWVNPQTRVYHLPGYRWYGQTRQGYYDSEEAAQKEGYRPAKNEHP